MALDLLIPWTLATQTTAEVAATSAGKYTLPQACNQVRVGYIGTNPSDAGLALLILATPVDETYVAASITKFTHAIKQGETIEIADGTWIKEISIWLGTGGTVSKTIIMGRFRKTGQ